MNTISRIPWNKGLKGVQVPWNKGIKTYVLPELKKCAECKEVLPAAKFGFRKSGQSKDHLRCYCRECERKLAIKWNSENSEQFKANSDRRRAESPEREKASSKKWRSKNRDWLNEYKRGKYASDPLYKLIQNLRGRIQTAIAGKSTKSAKTFELLGAPWVWVEAYLEEQFVPGMTWENYGPVWHIDHIRPCASFDLTDPDQQKICFHWTNLQPLFAADNLKKGCRE